MKLLMKNYWLVLILLFTVVFSCGEIRNIQNNPIIEIESGLVKGVTNDDAAVTVFKGIPFAAPPVGDLRWKAPQPPIPWEGVRDCSEFCASCMQDLKGTHLPNGPWTEEFMVQNEVSEDCLFLNVWTPAKSSKSKLPVLVYIHGGALTEGSGAIDVYDGEELAKKGILVVTINYRLGPFGFLAHPELTAESTYHGSGNYGFLDQVAALQWVQKNITAFGGNPDKVTIAGQSAGAGSVRALIGSPLAKGLFHRAITQSGSTFTRRFAAPTLKDAEKCGEEYAKLKGASSLAELRALSAKEILVPTQPYMRFGGVLDGYFQSVDLWTTVTEQKHNDTPFMTGLNADETRYVGKTDDMFKKLYNVDSDEALAAAQKLAGQEQSRMNAYLWLDFRAKTSQTPGYGYYFDRAIPWPDYPQFGAFHTGEVPYVFNTLAKLDRPWTKVDTLLAYQMSSYWANFVKNGDPNGAGLPIWAPYDSTKQMMRLGEHAGMIPVAASDAKYEFLKKQLLGEN